MHNLHSTIRQVSADETLTRVQPWLSDMGITRIANITGLDCIGIPVCIAIRPNSKNMAVSQGKGYSLALAKVSAVMESIESWHVENVDCEYIKGSYHALSAQQPLVDPSDFVVLPEEAIDIQQHQLRWIKVKELFSGDMVYLPRQLYSLDTTEERDVADVFRTSSNGLASGNSYAEALVHSLCELIERDATQRWFHASPQVQDASLLDNNSITSEAAKQFIKKISDQDLAVYIWQISNQSQVPSYFCSITDSQRLPHSLFSGAGTHLHSEVALLRAITEAAQARLTYISGSRDDVFPEFYREFDPTPVVQQLLNMQATGVYQHVDTSFASFEQAVDNILTALAKQDICRVYTLDHTREPYNIPVVHSLAPDLMRNLS